MSSKKAMKLAQKQAYAKHRSNITNSRFGSKKIGNFFRENKIQVDIVLSSEWCRCKDTAFYAFKKYETKSFLNSFFNAKFASNKNKQIND